MVRSFNSVNLCATVLYFGTRLSFLPRRYSLGKVGGGQAGSVVVWLYYGEPRSASRGEGRGQGRRWTGTWTELGEDLLCRRVVLGSMVGFSKSDATDDMDLYVCGVYLYIITQCSNRHSWSG